VPAAPARTKRRSGLGKAPRAALPEPGIGGYDYPRGPFGATGFPGSTPASKRTHSQGPDGRDDRQLTVSGAQAEWAALPSRRANGTPRQPRARQMRSTAPETRMVPVSALPPGSQNVRNQVAHRYKAVPGQIHRYQPASNPGKNADRLNAPSQYHPTVQVHGHPDGKPVPGMDSNPGQSNAVYVPSRYVSHEGGQEGYAVNRPLLFAKGGTPAAYPPWYKGNEHLRGGRLTGQRYFGPLAHQQHIGLSSDSYGIARARGPRHRPVRFEQPPPWTANYYDTAPQPAQPADMIHRSPSRGRPHAARPRRGK